MVACSPAVAAEAVLIISGCFSHALVLTWYDWLHNDSESAPWLDDVFVYWRMMLFADCMVIAWDVSWKRDAWEGYNCS